VNGVSRCSNGAGNFYWKACWIDVNGKSRGKSFSISKCGEEEAFRLACDYRNQMIEQLNAEGAGYTERHGKEVDYFATADTD
jgi:arabinogalactan endo-1,4-beta-galactosidase